MGTNRGWTVLFGGNAGTRPRFADIITRDLSATDALDCAERLAGFYRVRAHSHERVARFVERVGLDTLHTELLAFLPYIPLEKVK